VSSFLALGWVGMLLGLAGLAAAGWEWVSCGHEHLAGGHAFYHHHLFFGAHEHPHTADHPHKAPVPVPHRGKPLHNPATVTLAPALFQPTGVGVLLVPLAVTVSVVSTCVLPGVARPVIQPARPRGPPAFRRKDTQDVEARTR